MSWEARRWRMSSDNGPEFTALVVREWLGWVSVKTLYIEPGSPWENGYIESFNGKLWDELLNLEIFDTVLEAKVLVERWRRHYNALRPHSSLGYGPPAPEAVLPWPSGSASLRLPAYRTGRLAMATLR
jgi:putative transposase